MTHNYKQEIKRFARIFKEVSQQRVLNFRGEVKTLYGVIRNCSISQIEDETILNLVPAKWNTLRLLFWRLYGMIKDENLLDYQLSEISATANIQNSQSIQQVVQKMKITANPTSVNLEKYAHNLCVGFEFEGFGGNTEAIARKFNVIAGKTSGITKKEEQKAITIDGQTTYIKMKVDINRYKESAFVTDVYYDGSIGPETVTRPVLLNDLQDIKTEVFDYLKTQVQMKHIKAGLHMTFLNDKLAEKSNFEPNVVRNVIQFIRYFYPTLVEHYRQTSRQLSYRNLPEFEWVKRLSSEKYSAVNLRKSGDRIWGLEIRIPDGTDDFNIVAEQVVLYMAIIRHCAKLAQKGLIWIPQQVIDHHREYTRNISTAGTNQIALVKKLLDEELKFFTTKDENKIEENYEVTEATQ